MERDTSFVSKRGAYALYVADARTKGFGRVRVTYQVARRIGRAWTILTFMVVLAWSTATDVADARGLSAKDWVPRWPEAVKAPDGAPNIVLILLDDVGFGDTGTFGGAAQTPTLDRLAAEGLRYNHFHTTGLCSPTRAALLSGRNHHRMGFGTVGEAGYPGYFGLWKKSTVSVAEVLRRHGYSTAAFGKWHNTPLREISPIGPFDHWPTNLGFEYYYGNLLGASSQWEPELWRNTVQIEPPKTVAEGYHYTTDIVDEAIQWLHVQRSLASDKPYFIYLATGAAHGPLHVPEQWSSKYRGRFDEGWEKLRAENVARQKMLGVIPADTKLPPPPEGLPAWGSLSFDQKRIAAREMEIYAGFIAHTDDQMGRLIDAVKAAPGGENTLILYIVGDNGASAGHLRGFGATLSDSVEQIIKDLGGVKYINDYGAGWAIAGSTPFQGAKGVASHFGGTRNPLVVSWPARIKDKGGLRAQFTHVNDVAATLYDVIGIPMPDVIDGEKQLPLDGVSFAYSFEDAGAPSRHRLQYFEIWGNRAIYKDGWIAAARHRYPWEMQNRRNTPREPYATDAWELYNIDEDFSEAHNLAGRYPGKLHRLISLFDQEARRNDVYPLLPGNRHGATPSPKRRTRFTYYPGLIAPALDGPQFHGACTASSCRIEAEVVIPEEGAQGVIVSHGSRLGGFALYAKDDRLIYEYNLGAGRHMEVVSQVPLPHGRVTLAFDLAPATEMVVPTLEGAPRVGFGTGRLYFNGRLAGQGQAAIVPAFRGCFVVGRAFGSPVSAAFQSPFAFTGTLLEVRMDIE